MAARILIVDDDTTFMDNLKVVLEKHSYDVATAADAFEALALISQWEYDIIITDIILPRMNGWMLLRAIKQINNVPGTHIVVMSAYRSCDYALQARNRGAADFLIKPFSNDHLLLVIERVLNEKKILEENKRLREQLSERLGFHDLIGKNFKMQGIYDIIKTVSTTDATVLITGETGTGKDLVAQAIHFNSPRRDKRFVKVDCAMLSDTLLESELFGHQRGAFTHAVRDRIGRFEYAHEGTIFLDEIGNLPLNLQVKLLRVLQERKFERIGSNKTINVDVRILAATNKDLHKEIYRGRFREDLYYRLNVVQIQLPSLRERREDIPLLATYFVKKFSAKMNKEIRGLSRNALSTLMGCDWAGNIRELENTIERAVIMEQGGMISRVELPPAVESDRHPDPPNNIFDTSIPFSKLKKQLVSHFEKEYFRKLMVECKGNIMMASKRALMDYKSFYQKVKQYGLRRSDFTEKA